MAVSGTVMASVRAGSATRPLTNMPETAITYSTHGDSVFIVVPAEKGGGFSAQQVFVNAGERQDGLVVIEKGLSPGDRVVTSGQLRLYTGAAVAPSDKDTLSLAQESKP